MEHEIRSREWVKCKYLPAPTTPDDRGESSSGKISRYILQDLLPPNSVHCINFHITNPGLDKFGLERVRKRSGDVYFDLEVPNGNICGMNIGEGEGLPVVIQDAPFCFRGFVER